MPTKSNKPGRKIPTTDKTIAAQAKETEGKLTAQRLGGLLGVGLLGGSGGLHHLVVRSFADAFSEKLGFLVTPFGVLLVTPRFRRLVTV